MKDPAKLLLYLVGVVVIGALGAPLLYWSAQFLGSRNPSLDFTNYDFDTYFHRALLIAAILLLWPLLRALKVRSRSDLDLGKNPRAKRDTIIGFLIAATPLLCCGAVLIALGVYSFRHAFLWPKMPAVLAAAIIVPLVEEAFFRGLVLGVLSRGFSRLVAVVLTSAFFSIIHFLKAPETAPPGESITWVSGFVSMGDSFSQFRDPFSVAAGFLTLFTIGCILADARLATRSLWLPIGLHAGWIFANGTFSKAAHREMLAIPWLGKDLLVGIVPLILALTSWALMRNWIRYATARPAQLPSGTR